MVDIDSLSSAQARAYASAARSCAGQLAAPLQAVPETDPGVVAQGTGFKSPGATGLWAELDTIGGDLRNARSRLREVVAELQRISEHYGELAEKLHRQEEAARERARAAAERMRGRGPDPLPMPVMPSGPLFPELGGNR
jgi:hypothetical protein